MSILKQFKGLEISYSPVCSTIGDNKLKVERSVAVAVEIEMVRKTETTPSLVIFTDGACTNNQARYGQKAGYAIVCPNHPAHNWAGPLIDNNKTNNRAEMRGLIKAFEAARAIDPSYRETMHLYSDSMLVIDGATKWLAGWKKKGWKKRDGSQVLNQDLWMIIDNEMVRRKVKFIHVRAHTGGSDWASRWNAEADRAATGACA